MKQPRRIRLIGLLFVAALSGCAICKSSDNAEQCRTKQRDHGHSRVSVHAIDGSTLPS
jgi:hypothetical protein